MEHNNGTERYSFKNRYTAIACVNKSMAIGRDGKLLYHINADLSNFKSMTDGNVVIMGRKTFESLPGLKPLKGRVNIVITSKENYVVDGADDEEFCDTYVCSSLEDADSLCYAFFGDRQLFIIGGESIYRQAIDAGIVDEVRLTVVNDDAEGDAHFPDIESDVNYKRVFRTSSLRDYSNDNDLYYRYVFFRKVA